MLVVQHWPLPNHEYAYEAARAAECAAAQGSFEAFHDLLFAKQDSLGEKPFTELARESAVPDLWAFDACMLSSSADAKIQQGIAAADEVGARGTPTVMVNGLLLPYVPDSTRLKSLVGDALKGGDTR